MIKINSKDGSYRVRIGKLIEEFICKKYDLQYNKRQHKYGFYDAYNKDHIYEIKGSKNTSGRFFIRSKNHKDLMAAKGIYIYIIYELIDTDKELRMITDINILQIIFINAIDINKSIIKSKKEYFNKYVNKNYYRLSIKEILNVGGLNDL